MAFDLLTFMLCPSLEDFNRCRKDDLLLIADFFNLSVCQTASKKVVKAELYEALVAQQVLPERDALPGSNPASPTQPHQVPGRAELEEAEVRGPEA
ncbi:hexokinase-2 isoform X1 [Tachysurus ichikawai]